MMTASLKEDVEPCLQYDLIELSTLLGIQTDEEGVCHGFAMMGIIAALAEDLKNFEERIEKIKSITSNKEIKEFLTILRATTDKAFPLSAKTSYQEIETFLTTMTLLQMPEEFTEFFPKKTPLQQTNFVPLIQLALPLNLDSKDEDKTINISKPWSGCYTKRETEIFLSKIAALTKKQPIALLLGSKHHAISVIYNPTDTINPWCLIDANIRKGTIHCKTAREIRDNIFSCLDHTQNEIVFYSQAFHIGKLEQSIDELNSKDLDEEWTRIHQVTKKKARNSDWLYIAAHDGDVTTVKAILNKNLKHNLMPAFCTAIQNNHLEIVQLLLNAGIDINKTLNGNPPLYLAAECGHSEITALLLKEGANPNLDNHKGYPSLHAAIFYNHHDIVKLLLSHKDIHLEQINSNGYSALALAADAGNLEIVKTLLDAGANVNSTDSDDRYSASVSPLEAALCASEESSDTSSLEAYFEIILVLLRNEKIKIKPTILKSILEKTDLLAYITKQPDDMHLLSKIINMKEKTLQVGKKIKGNPYATETVYLSSLTKKSRKEEEAITYAESIH